MRPFATLSSRLTKGKRYKAAMTNAWGWGAMAGIGGGAALSLIPTDSAPTLLEGIVQGSMGGVAVVATITLLNRFERFLMRYAQRDDAQPATQTLTDEHLDVTGGCSGEGHGWRCSDDPNMGGCGKETGERPRRQPQPEPNRDTR